MSLVAFAGALEFGFVYGLVALGVFLSFRVLNFPDLTVDGSFPLGAAVTAALVFGGVDPFVATAAAVVAGAVAGLITAQLSLRFNILHLLAGILTMTALYSINLRIMGRPNIAIINQPTILTPFEFLGVPETYLKPALAFIVVMAAGLLLSRFLNSDFGLGLRAAGANVRVSRAMGVSTPLAVCLGMAISNSMVALAGALFAQMNGFADISIGIGTIIVGLASVVVGEAIVRGRGMLVAVIACIAGAVIYRLAVTVALNTDFLGLKASDLNFATAVLVALALILPSARNPVKTLLARRAMT